MGRAWPRSEEKYDIGRGNFYNYGNCNSLKGRIRKSRGRKGKDMDLGRGKGCVGELWEAEDWVRVRVGEWRQLKGGIGKVGAGREG